MKRQKQSPGTRLCRGSARSRSWCRVCHAASRQTHTAHGSSEPISLERRKKASSLGFLFPLLALAVSATNTTFVTS
jgi:hypothetical protein